MTGSMAKFNQDYPRIPEDILFYNYGAEADLNEDRRIQKSEAVPLLPSFLPALGVELIANAMYSAIGGVMSITVTKSTSSWGENDFTTIEADPAGLPFRQNDLTVTAFSAHAPNGEYLNTIFANHSSIKSAGLAQEIVDRIQSKFPVR
jgi:hypothetical protein